MSETTTTTETVVELTVNQSKADTNLRKQAGRIQKSISSLAKFKREMGELLTAVVESGDLEVRGITLEQFYGSEDFFGDRTLAKSEVTEAMKFARFTTFLERDGITEATNFAPSVYRNVPVTTNAKAIVKAVKAIQAVPAKVTQGRLAAAFGKETATADSTPEEEADITPDSEESQWLGAMKTARLLLTDGYVPNKNQLKNLKALLRDATSASDTNK